MAGQAYIPSVCFRLSAQPFSDCKEFLKDLASKPAFFMVFFTL